jgi:ABC-type multidrug transport system fused ATPase/permease subunit
MLEDRILWLVRMYADTQINMNSVERVREYTLELPQEPQGGSEPPAYWPSSRGGIQVEHLAARYADGLPLALKDISFEVKPSVSQSASSADSNG